MLWCVQVVLNPYSFCCSQLIYFSHAPYMTHIFIFQLLVSALRVWIGGGCSILGGALMWTFPPLSLPDSPSLVALVMDSEEDEEGFLVKSSLSPISPLTSDPRSSGDDTSPDLTCTRTHSASSDGDPTLAKVPG